MARKMQVQVYGNDQEAANLVVPYGSQVELQVDSEELVGFPMGFTFSVLISRVTEPPVADGDATKQLPAPEKPDPEPEPASGKAKLTRR